MARTAVPAAESAAGFLQALEGLGPQQDLQGRALGATDGTPTGPDSVGRGLSQVRAELRPGSGTPKGWSSREGALLGQALP